MESNYTISIKLKKTKIMNSIIVLILFYFFTLYMFLNSELFVSKIFRSIFFIKIISFFGILYSLILLISYIIKLFDNKVGLTIMNEYIIDNSVYESIGIIYWKDIKSIKIENKYVLLNITNQFEEDYIKRLNLFKKIIIIIKKRSYKKNIMINCINLDCSNEELYDYLNKSFLKYKEISKF